MCIVIIKRISRAPIYHTRWEHRALYNNTNDTHTHTRSRVGRGDRHDCEKQLRNTHAQTQTQSAGKNSLSAPTMLMTMEVEVEELCTSTVTSTPIMSPATGLVSTWDCWNTSPAFLPATRQFSLCFTSQRVQIMWRTL